MTTISAISASRAEEARLYRPPTKPMLVDVPTFEFLVVDGAGSPESGAFGEAVSALYSLTYPVVIALRRAGHEAKVWPLEALWWAGDVAAFDPAAHRREEWRWRAMIRQVPDVPAELRADALGRAGRKLGDDIAGRAVLRKWGEGRCAQVMHVGPYAAEGPTIAALHAFVAEQGLRLRGHHHEIYLSDPRRCAPEKMRTVLRHPVR